jgi:acyl-CoA synthetase (NDP forming)
VTLDRVFDPRSVAVVGASDTPGKLGTTLMRNLERFTGDVIPISASRDSVAGRRAYRRLQDVPGPVDLVVAAVPAAAVPEVVADAAAAGAGAVAILSGGFAEVGPEGSALQERIVAAARAGGVRIVGPNCLGVQNCATRLNATMAAGTPDAAGAISLATQSGAYGMAVYMLGLEAGMHFAKVYASGNKADLTDAEVLAHLGADPDTGVACFFLESIADARGFVDIAREVTTRKPVLVAKTGRTAAGARAALSHTAALAGDAALWRPVLEQAGVVVVDSGLEMMDSARALDWQPVPSGPRAGIITNSGGTGVELTDLLTEQGLEVPELSDRLQAELAAALPAYGSPRNPVDVTTAWARFAELYPLAIDRLARSGEVDIVVPVLLQRAAMDPEVIAAVLDVIDRLRADGIGVPVYVCWVAPAAANEFRARLHAARVPCFEWPQRTARAAALAARYGRLCTRPREMATAIAPDGLDAVGSGPLAPDAAARLARAFGVDVPEQAICDDADAAAAAAERIGFPVAAKLAGGRHVHKLEAGGVRLDLRDGAAVRAAAADLLALDPDAGVLVQPMLAGTEIVVGGLRDAALGAVVMVGLGGVFVETLGDVAFRLAPVTEAEAVEAIESLRAFPLLAGARGRPAADLRALAATVVAASQLLAGVSEIAELDLNPVLAGPDRAAAVDVRIVGAAAPPRPTAPGTDARPGIVNRDRTGSSVPH